MRTFFGEYESDQKFADVHIHTNKSSGILTPTQVVDLAVESKFLHTIAITDYNTIKSAVEAKNYCAKTGCNLEVIIGSEIATTDGHILGLYLKQDISKNNSLESSIIEIHKQEGLVIIPHPFQNEQSLNNVTIKNIIDSKDKYLYFDGFEIFNARENKDLESPIVKNTTIFYLENKAKLGAAIGVSATHGNFLGQGLTGYKESLGKAIKTSQTSVFYLEEEELKKLQNLANHLFS